MRLSPAPCRRVARRTIMLTRGLEPADIFSKLLQVRSQPNALSPNPNKRTSP